MAKLYLPFLCLIAASILNGCKSRPSNDEIKSCLLKQYDCGNSAQVNSLQLVNSRKIKDLFGQEEYECIVTGEIQWISDCESLLHVIPRGKKEPFQNKEVYLLKMDKGWGCP